MTDIPRLQDPSFNASMDQLQMQAGMLREGQQPQPQQEAVQQQIEQPVQIPDQYSTVGIPSSDDFAGERTKSLELFKQALRVDPVRYQQAQEFARQRGIDPQTADQNVDVMQDMISADQRKMDQLRREAPTVYNLMQNPFYAKMVAQQTDDLLRAETSAGGWLGRQISGQINQLEYSTEALRLMAQGANPDDLEKLRRLDRLQKLYAKENDDSWLAWGASTAIQTTMFMVEAWGAAALGSLVAGPGGPAAGVAFGASVEGGSLYGDLILENEERRLQGKEQIDMAAAAPIIGGAAMVSGVLDMFGARAVKGPWKKQLIRGAINAGAETFKDITAQQAWSNFRKNLFTAWATETLTEGLQKVAMVTGEQIARANADPTYGDTFDWEKLGSEAWTGFWQEMGAAAVGIAPLVGVGATRRVRRDLALSRIADKQRDKWNSITQPIVTSELGQNAPSVAGDTVSEIARKEGITHVYINKRDLDQALSDADAFEAGQIAEEVGVSPEAVKKQAADVGRARRTLRQLLPDVADQMDSAVDDSADIKISAADFATHMAGRRIGLALQGKGLLKLDADGMSKAERDVELKRLEKVLEFQQQVPGQLVANIVSPEQAVGGQQSQLVTGAVQLQGVTMAIQNEQVSDSMQSSLAQDYVAKGLFENTEEGQQAAETSAAMQTLFLRQVADSEGRALDDVANSEGVIWESNLPAEPQQRQPMQFIRMGDGAEAAAGAAAEAAVPPVVAGAETTAPEAKGNVPGRIQAAALRQIGVLGDLYQKNASRWAAGRMSDEEFADAVIAYERPVRPDERKAQLVSVLGTAKKVAEWKRKSFKLASMGLPMEGAESSLQEQNGRERTTTDLADAAGEAGVQVGGGVSGGTFLLDEPSGPKPGAALAGLPPTVEVNGQPVAFGPNEIARQIAREYVASTGLLYSPPAIYAPIDVARARRIAQAYEDMVHRPNDPDVAAAYRALADETVKHYEAMLKSGITVLFNPPGINPYPNPREALIDIRDNNRLYIFSTEDGYGQQGISDKDRVENPMLAVSAYKFGDKPALVNDLFRAVHDYFGHYKEGVGFRARGEENAWQQHMAMYSPLARKAATVELRGQNSWVNFGPHAQANATASGETTVYAPQKIGLLPDWVVTEGWLGEATRLPARPGSGGNLSPALAWGVEADPTRRDSLVVHLPTLETAMAAGGEDFLRKNVSLFKGGVKKVKDKKTGKVKKVTTYDSIQMPKGTVREQAESIVTQIQRNLTFIWQAIPPEIRKRSRLWYVGANRIANGFSMRYGKTLEQMAGMLAVLSPQADWRMNVSYCERICDFMRRHDAGEEFAWTPELDAWAQEWLNSKEETKARVRREQNAQAKLVAAEQQLKEAEAAAAASPQRRGLQTAVRKAQELVETRKEKIAKGDDNINTYKLIVEAKTFRGISDDVAKAFFIRAHDEVVNGTQFADVSPEGEFLGPVLNDDGKTPQVLAWKSMNAIAKAIRVWEASSNAEVDAALGVISDQLGGEHKVRNFYNNILDPHSETAFYTSDTHQVAAGLMLPLGASAVEVGQNFGTTGSSSSSSLGLSGTYFLHHEAGIRTAAEVSTADDRVLPREVQSVTWEGVRNLFSDTFKSKPSNIEAVRAIWQQAAAGEKTYEQATQEIVKLAGGFRPPSWVGIEPGSGRTPESGAKTYGRAVQGDGVPGLRPGRSAGGTAGRGGKAVSKKGKRLNSMAFKPLDEEYSAQVKELGLDTPEGYAKAQPQEKAMLWQYVRNAATAAGYDLAAYHGTKTKAATKLPSTKPFTVFRTVVPIELGAHFSVERAVGMSFALQNVEYPVGTSDVKRAENQLFDVYLRVKNPLRLKDEGNWVEHRILKQMQDLGLELESKEPLSTAMLRLQIKAKQELMARPELRIHPLLERKLEDMEADGATQQELNDATEKFVSAMAETRALQLLIMELGYDSVVYVNRREVVIGEEQHRGDMPDARRRRLEAAIYRDADVGLTDAEFLARVPEARDAYIVWEPASIKSADPVTFDENGRMIPLSERFNVKKNSILYSSGAVPPGQPRQEAWFDISTRQARLLDVGNVRSHLHEQAHNMMRWLFDASQRPNARANHVRDVQILLNWFEVADIEAWNKLSPEQQEAYWEAFAYSYEKYLFEGVAPSPGLRGIFERLSRYIRRYYQEVVENINRTYRAATGRDLPMLTDEVRGVMGRMLAAERAVDETIEAHSLEPMFQTRAEFPGTDEEWEGHLELQQSGREAAIAELTKATLDQLKFADPAISSVLAKQNKQIKAIRDRIRGEVEEEISMQPVYRLINYFRTGILIDANGEFVRNDSKQPHGHRLDREKVELLAKNMLSPGSQGDPNITWAKVERHPDGDMRLQRGSLDRFMRRGGVDPEFVATAFGFIDTDADGVISADVNAMMQALSLAPSLESAVEARTQARMEQEYGNLIDPRQRRQAVWESVHNEVRARMVAAESVWLDNNLARVAQAMSPGRQQQVQRARDAVASITPQLVAAREERQALLDSDEIDLQRLTWLDLQIDALEKQRARFAAATRSSVPERLLAQAAAGVARRNLERRVIGDINARDFVAQEQQAAKSARDAMTRGTGTLTDAARRMRYVAASQFKQRQLLYGQMAAEALSIRRETELFRTFVNRLFGIGQTRAKQLEMSYVNAAQALLAELGYAPDSFTPERIQQIYGTIQQLDPVLWQEVNRTIQPLRDVIRSLPPAGVAGRATPAWQRLTVEQWRSMRDAVEVLYDAARSRGQYLTAERRTAFRAERDTLLAAISEKTLDLPMVTEFRKQTEMEEKVGGFRSWLASLKRVEHYLLKLDGGKPGVWTRLIWDPINAAFVSYEARRQEVLRRYADILRAAPLEQDLPKNRKSIEFRRRDGTLVYVFQDMSELLGALLHIGNMSNKRKMILGGAGTRNPFGKMVRDSQTGEMRLDSSDFDSFVESLNESGRLTAEHWQFLQNVWNLTESMLPGIQRSYKRITGNLMRTVGRQPFTNRYGTFEGGYVPARIDPTRSAIGQRAESVAELQADMRNQMPMAEDGFTIERIESVQEPLLFNLRMVEQHLDSVLRYTEIAPYANDVNRLLTDYTVANSLMRMDPNLYSQILKPWLSRALNNTTSTPGNSKAWNRIWSALRRNTTLGKMFANVPNALQNLSGLTMGLLRIPPKYWAHSIYSYATGGWGEMTQNARQSLFMESHLGNQMSSLVSEMRNYVDRPSRYGRFKQFIEQNALFAQNATQNIVDVITWNAAFDESMSNASPALEQSEARANAIRYADSVVRTSQLSLRAIDISALEAGHPFVKLMIQFTSYFNSVAQANITAYSQILQGAGMNPRRAVGQLLYTYMVGLAMPAVIGEMLVRLLGRGFEEEDDDGRMTTAWFDMLVMSQVRFAAGAIPFGQQAASLTVNQWDDVKYNDRMAAGPAIETLIRGSQGAGNLFDALFLGGKLRADTPRDVMSLIQMIGGVPLEPLGRPVGFATKVGMGTVEPEGLLDWSRGLLTGQVAPGIKK